MGRRRRKGKGRGGKNGGKGRGKEGKGKREGREGPPTAFWTN